VYHIFHCELKGDAKRVSFGPRSRAHGFGLWDFHLSSGTEEKQKGLVFSLQLEKYLSAFYPAPT